MRILVTGGRTYDDPAAVLRALITAERDADQSRGAEQFLRPMRVTLVHGDASGADRLAAQFAELLDWQVEAHPADWRKHGRAAGPIRNQHMADLGADVLIAFPGGKGTADCVRRAEAAGIPVHHVTTEKENQ